MAGIRVDESLVRKVADLANLYLTEQEVVLYQGRLARILEYVEQLGVGKEEASSERKAEPFGSSPPEGCERSDEVTSSLPIEEAVGQAAVRSGTAFQVPRIIE